MDRAGVGLSVWQLDVLSDWSAVDADGQFVHRRCGASVPRQTGKSHVAIPWALALAMALGAKVLYTAHNYSTTCEMLRRMRDVLGRKPHDPAAKHPEFNAQLTEVNNKTAQEAFFLASGGSVHFSTRTRSATLGYGFDVVIYDEAQELTDEQQQAILPTTSSGALGNPQSVYIGTPPRPHSPGGAIFEGMREEAARGEASDLCWWEWGVAEVGDITDESRWYGVNPSLGKTASPEALRMATGSMSPLAFAQEYLGYWLPKGQIVRLIKEDDWMACATFDPPASGRVAYGVKFGMEGGEAALAVALEPNEGPVHVELIDVIDLSGGLTALTSWLVERQERACSVAMDGLGGSAALAELMDAAGADPGYAHQATTREYTTAASGLVEAVKARSVTWFAGDEALSDAIAVTTSRRIGSAGAFGFGGEDPLPADAVALALWAVKNSTRDPSRVQEVW